MRISLFLLAGWIVLGFFVSIWFGYNVNWTIQWIWNFFYILGGVVFGALFGVQSIKNR